jgi:hypothetical protein
MSSACPWSPVSVYAKRTMADHLPRMKSRNSSSDSKPMSTSSPPKRAATRQLVAWSRRVRLVIKDLVKEALHDALYVPGSGGLDRAWSLRLSAASWELLWMLAARAGDIND